MPNELEAIEQCANHLRDSRSSKITQNSTKQSNACDTPNSRRLNRFVSHSCSFFRKTRRMDRGQDLSGTLPYTSRRSWRQRYCEGWRACAAASCVTAALVLFINITITSWAAKQHPPVNGIGVLFPGNCERAKQLNTWLQLIVNILSSILLAASNFCMQCLTSPTRAEVDKAHSRGYSLDIGLSSIRNITAICWKRRLLWIGLGLSAMPLHFVSV